MRTATNPSGATVYFDEAHHKYFVGDVVLTPVTTFVGSFFPKFDTENIAEKYALKHGCKTEDVLARWEDARLKGEELGTAVHEYAYGEITGDRWPAPEKYEPYYQNVDRALAEIKRKFEILGAEEIVFSQKFGLGGTIDLICEDPTNGDMLIFDWKTNRQLQLDNVWENGLPPLQGLEDCDLVRYTLQVNVYEFILREEQYFPGANFRRGLIHLVGDRPKWYKVQDMQVEIKEMLKSI
jgi:ATP-dependent exoDNAse (exonuclease V) beta subunit